MSSFYIAGRYCWRPMIQSVKMTLESLGHEVTARWIDGAEEGLNRTDIALLDLEDIDKATYFLCFTEPYNSWSTSGGRHVEFGYALAKGKKIYVIGDLENVFYHHPDISVFKDFTAFLKELIYES